MNKNFNLIINTLIIILIIALVAVMMNYYANTGVVPTFINNSGDSSHENKLSGEIIKNEENIKNIDKIIEIYESGEINMESTSGDLTVNNKDGLVANNQDEKYTSPVIISSENEISSKEKGEILSELDNALMELLEVVDKVQIVDETRLITDDSEVQK